MQTKSKIRSNGIYQFVNKTTFVPFPFDFAMPRVTLSLFLIVGKESNSPFSHLHSSEHGLVSNRLFYFVFFICNKPEVLFRVKTLRLPCVKKTADSGHQGISHAYCIFYYCVYISDHIPWYIFELISLCTYLMIYDFTCICDMYVLSSLNFV